LSHRSLAAAIAFLLLADLGVVAARSGEDSHPDHWDPRVAPIAEWVEQARGLSFDHPVPVDFLSPADYTKATTSGDDPLEEEQAEEMDQTVSELRALGVASGPLDLKAAIDQVNDAGTLAFYSPGDERVRIRGSEMTVGLRVTLAHELTHALQDQHFHIGKLLDEASDAGQASARRALAEGDATRIEDEYVRDELTDAEQREYEAELAREVDRTTSDTAGVPDFLTAAFAAPYALGPPFVALLHTKGGNKGVDEGFRNPPSTEEHLFDPASYLAEETAGEVALGKGASHEDVLGITSWYLVLAQRIDPWQAFEAALGWDGDAVGRVRDRDRSCVRAVFRGDTDEDEQQMADAIAAWAAALPPDQARSIERGDHPGFEACDPGPAEDLHVRGRSTDLLVLPNTWAYLEGEASEVLTPAGDRCFARALLQGISVEELNDPAQQDRLRDQLQRAAPAALQACASPEGSATPAGYRSAQRATSASRSSGRTPAFGLARHSDSGTVHTISNSLPSGSWP
jgi:hypothetical protein